MEAVARCRREEGSGQQGNRKDGKRWLNRAIRRPPFGLCLALAGLILWPSLQFAKAGQVGGTASAPPEAVSGAQLTPTSQPRVTLRVYNYAHLDSAVLASARESAAFIFKQAGVEMDWVDCALTPTDFELYPACQPKTRTTDFAVRIMTASMAAKLPTSDGPLGFAQQCPDDERGCVANVFYSRVDELSSQVDTRASRILGHAMAHEVGHLLLGPNAHSSNGLMRGLWTPDDLRFMNWSYLFFTPGQSRQLRTSLARRTSLELSSDFRASNLPAGQ